ncbi:nitrite reductase (NADH) large subunit [Paenarthrobacter nitroguajacolicus]|uniref:NAD(P)/FAD-dependent oxidoreductase n=1 Tax=Paenarthrobacter nitroguajacolicus TaxID=211146 RepID=UPI00285C2FB2|nr:FAD-dependent oxidoreductase [Paenarthrobacter nitroguajacolicus]MDR6988026.1 nitrite reductase (NADH) large subunit [Paenarthrobacter nitroguajacolicus]
MKQRLVVIGNGMAGARAVEEILARGGADMFQITMFGDEPYGNYNRTRLGRVLTGEDSETDLVINPLQWYRQHDIALHTGRRVERVDKFSRHVFASNGRVVEYDLLIIATGSHSFLPPMDGLHTPSGTIRHGVFTFRTLDDARRMVQFARQKDHHRAAVIGGGPFGPEAAHGLEAQGLEVEVHAGSRTTAILGSDRIAGLGFRDQPNLDCDMVVVTAGIRPNVDVAVVSGLAVERGIVVDDHLRVMDEEEIYAVGECVQHRGEVYGTVPPLWEQAAVLADHVTGVDRSSMYLGTRTLPLNTAGALLAPAGGK